MSNFDDILDHVGKFGPYQRTLVALLYAPNLLVGMQALSYIFISAVPKHRCYVGSCDDNVTSYWEAFLNWTTSWDSSDDSFSSCTVYGNANPRNKSGLSVFGSLANQIPLTVDDGQRNSTTCQDYNFDRNTTDVCDNWIFDQSTYRSTVVSDWQLVCDNSYLVALSQSAYMLGVMIGSVLFGFVADRYGRKNAIISAVVIAALAGIVTPFLPYYSMLLVMKVIIGTSYQGIFITTFVMSMEFVGKSKRAFCGLLANIYFSVGEIFLGILAFYIRDWKLLQMVISVPMLIFISYIWLIPESPRWLISRKKFERADLILEKIANSNKRTMPFEMIKSIGDAKAEENKTNSDSVTRTIISICQSSSMRWRTISMAFNWMMITLAYYGITLSTPKLGGNEFCSFVEVCAVELPSYVFSILVLNRFGRRLPLCLSMIGGGIASFCTYFVPASPQYLWLSIGLALVAKFGAASAFAIVYVFTAELFPTTIRNNAIGFCAMVGHIGGVIAPYIAFLSSSYPVLPMMIYGMCSLLAGLATLSLPETVNQKLPDTIQEAVEFGN